MSYLKYEGERYVRKFNSSAQLKLKVEEGQYGIFLEPTVRWVRGRKVIEEKLVFGETGEKIQKVTIRANKNPKLIEQKLDRKADLEKQFVTQEGAIYSLPKRHNWKQIARSTLAGMEAFVEHHRKSS